MTGTSELCVSGRGSREEIDVFPGKALANPMSVNVVDICPVGALLSKDFLFERRVWELTSTPTIDGLTSGGDNLWADHADGIIYRFRPRENDQVNKWWTSDEIRFSWKHVHSDQRLRDPMVRREDQQTEVAWADALGEAVKRLREATESGGRLAVVVSPMLSCEDAYHLGQLAKALDPNALIVEGPVPTEGEDQTMPGGYTIRAEKAPNARGVRRVLEQVCGFGNVSSFHDAVNGALSSDQQIRGLILTGNYPSDWITDRLAGCVGDKVLVMIDTLTNRLTERADVLLPAATWLEKAGTFENVDSRLQAFERAITPIEWARSESQIAIDLLAEAGAGERRQYDAAATRQAMGGAFTEQVQYPSARDTRRSEMEYVEL